jgi:Tol biopolymer transport system component
MMKSRRQELKTKNCGLNNFLFHTSTLLPVKFCALLSVLVLATLITGCAGPRLSSFPFDPSGRSLNSPYAEMSPQISGKYLVFASDRAGSQDIFLYDTVTRNLVDLPGLNAIDMIASSPAVSDNGQFIVFVGVREGRSGIYFYDRNTRQLRNLTENLKAEVRNPSISGDGNMIAFQSSTGGQWDIVFYNRFGQPFNALSSP